nr:type I 3-dehydroquinate dehydratase [Clostridium botulinum]
MRTVKIRKIILGEGIPKICVPLGRKNIEELEQEIRTLNNIDFDLVEFRADFFENVENISEVKKTFLRLEVYYRILRYYLHLEVIERVGQEK